MQLGLQSSARSITGPSGRQGVRLRFVAAILGVCSVLACRRVDPNDVGIAPSRRQAPPPVRPEETADTPPVATVVLPDFAKVATDLSPSVVSVISTVKKGDAARTNTVRGLGSGMIVTAGGQILTNDHVVREASTIDVELSTRDRVTAALRYSDPLLDLALIELAAPVAGLVPVEFEDAAPTPGEWVMAVGQPFALGHTVTVGVVSGTSRDFDDLGRPPGLRRDGIWSFIQTDASINIGNSGGPLVNADGKVIGVTTAVRNDGQGLAFAIPGPMARKFLEEVWTFGRVRHARLGIRAEDAGPQAVPGRASVVRITAVESGGPGAKAGLQVGDLVLAINDRPVLRVSDVAFQTQLLGVGSRLRLTIRRGDEPPQQVLVLPAEGAS